jgi:hypothetical protein
MSFIDVDWVGFPNTRHSVIGWCMFLGGDLISWKSKKHDRVSKSSIKFEYRAMLLACFKIVWLWGLLGELGIPQLALTSLYVDNTSAIQIIVNLVFYERIKHIEIDCHYIHEILDQHVITLSYIFIKF